MPYGNIMSGMGRFYIELWVTIVRFILYIITIILLLSPKYFGLGAIGLAMSTLFMNIFEGLSYFFIAKKVGQIKTSYINVIRHILIIGISIAFYFLIPILSDFTPSWWLLIIPIYLIVTFVFFHLVGLLTREQIKTIIELLNIKKTVSYIKNEFKEK
jgi:O-antigen/teichoic acid export membrane protein